MWVRLDTPYRWNETQSPSCVSQTSQDILYPQMRSSLGLSKDLDQGHEETWGSGSRIWVRWASSSPKCLIRSCFYLEFGYFCSSWIFFFFAVTLIFKGTRLNCYFYLFYWVLTPPYILCLGSVPHWLYPSHSPVGTLLQGRIWLNRSLNHSLLARSSSSSFPTPSQASVALY